MTAPPVLDQSLATEIWARADDHSPVRKRMVYMSPDPVRPSTQPDRITSPEYADPGTAEIQRPSVDPAVRARFVQLSTHWHAEVGTLSSVTRRLLHDDYQTIMTMGWPVVPELLADLGRGHVHWFHALRIITGEDPVNPADYGNLAAMAASWLEWGRARGYLA